MKIRILGSAAGGGLPQWNCRCPNCDAALAGDPAVPPRTQSSIAASADGRRWVLFNASPDLREQAARLLPESRGTGEDEGPRRSPISAVLVTDAEIDHTSGLLLLREGRELVLYSTAFVQEALLGSGLLPTLGAYLDVTWREIVPGGRPFQLADATGEGLGVEIEAFEVAGDPPLYWRGEGRSGAGQAIGSGAGQVIGVKIRTPAPRADNRRAVVYVPGAASAERILQAGIEPADVLLMDGTFWVDDELARLGISRRTATDMGHLPISGASGSLEAFRGVRASRKAYLHVNNTNPILREGSPERREAEAAGWEVAHDGLELEI